MEEGPLTGAIWPVEADSEISVEIQVATLSTLMQKYSTVNFICQVHLYGDETDANSYTTAMVLDPLTSKVYCEARCDLTANLAEESSFLEFIPIIDDIYVLSAHRFHCRKPPMLDAIVGRTVFYTDIQEYS